MGKKGPCFHCGIEWTPLWRNGPAHKPVLCNACGSRWRIWGNLENYTPKHGMGGPSCKDTQRSQQSKLPIPFEARKLRKPKRRSHGFEQDTKKGTRSGSAISSSHNCIHCDSKTGKEESGSVKPSLWDNQIPRRKRSVLTQYILTRVGWLHRQLRYILQEQEFSKLPREQEEVLISQNGQMPSAEIGLGCVQLKSPGSPEEENSESPGSPQEENSESSSFTPENESSGLYESP